MILYILSLSFLVAPSLQQSYELQFKPPPNTASVDYPFLPDGSVCGLGTKKNEEGINDFPWIAALKYASDDGEDGGYRCGGTLVNEKFIVTTAECLNIEGYKLTGVRLGQKPFSGDIVIKENIPFPGYYPSNPQDNIGLIRLENEVKFDDLVRPVCLHAASRDETILRGLKLISGWKENGECDGTIGGAVLDSYSTTPFLNETQYFQEGIVLWKTECGYTLELNFRVRISDKLYWITNVMAK